MMPCHAAIAGGAYAITNKETWTMNANDTSTGTDILIDATRLHALVCGLWEQAGSEPTEARLVGDHLVQANLSGHDSHGVGMIPRYLRSLRDGELKLNMHARIARDA